LINQASKAVSSVVTEAYYINILAVEAIINGKDVVIEANDGLIASLSRK
jgi:hypothetical protein